MYELFITVGYNQNELENVVSDVLAQAWLHPETIKVVDDVE